MATCFLFITSWPIETCLSLKIDQGAVVAPLAFRSVDEFKLLQAQAKTIVVLSTALVNLFTLTLPSLPEKKLRAAIPYALEDSLAQPVHELHVAFAKQLTSQPLLVVVMAKAQLADLCDHLHELELVFDSITLDWFALNEDEAWVSPSYLLVNSADFKGAISTDMASFYENQVSNVYVFEDSMPAFADVLGVQRELPFGLAVAQGLLQKPLFNLCKGDFAQHKPGLGLYKRYQATLGLSLMLFLGVLLTPGLKGLYLTHQVHRVDQKIAALYPSFFPQDHDVQHADLRLQLWLKNHNDAGNEPFWLLLNKVTSAMDNNRIQLIRWRFGQQGLNLSLQANSFADLVAFQDRLQALHLKVSQTQAKSEKQHVMAILELRL